MMLVIYGIILYIMIVATDYLIDSIPKITFWNITLNTEVIVIPVGVVMLMFLGYYIEKRKK